MGRGKTTQENKTTAGGRVMNLSATCRVCNCPSAPHTHYGAVCCYSCRAFFRRGIHRSYTCVLGNGTCQVNSVNRTNCKKCRFDRCLLVGMNPNLVDASIKSKQIINNDTNTFQPISMEMIPPNTVADPYQIIFQLTQNQEGDNQGGFCHFQQNPGNNQNMEEIFKQQLLQHQLHQQPLDHQHHQQFNQQHQAKQRKTVARSKQKKGKKSVGSQQIPAVQPIVDTGLTLTVPQSIDLEVNPTVLPTNDAELNPIVVTATAETEHLLNQLEECEDQALSPFMIDPEFINEIAGMEDESNSTSTFSTDSTFSNQLSNKETDKEFDELSEEFNLDDPGDGQGFPDQSAFNDFLLHGFRSSQQKKGFPFPSDLSPSDLVSTDLSNKNKFNTTNLSKQGEKIVGVSDEVTYNNFNIKDIVANDDEHTEDAELGNCDESYHAADTLCQIIQNSLEQDTNDFSQSSQSPDSEELTYVFPIIHEEDGPGQLQDQLHGYLNNHEQHEPNNQLNGHQRNQLHDQLHDQPVSLTRMEKGLIDDTNGGNNDFINPTKEESIGIDHEEHYDPNDKDDNIGAEDSDNSGLEDDAVCIQESVLDNLEIKQEEIDIDDIIHLDFQQDIHIQKKVELESRNNKNPEINHISRNLFPHEKPPSVNIPGYSARGSLPGHSSGKDFSPVNGPTAGSQSYHQVDCRNSTGRLSPYARYTGGHSSYNISTPTPHRSAFTPIRLTLPGRIPQGARAFQQVPADLSRVKYKARPTQLSYRDNTVPLHIPNLTRVSKESASPNMAFYTTPTSSRESASPNMAFYATPTPSRVSTSPDVTYNILSPPSRAQVGGKMNVEASVHQLQYNLQSRLNCKPLKPTNLFLQQSNFLSK